MGRNYGHDHRDKFELIFWGRGRLLYPDWNAQQYEPMEYGWTRNAWAHSALVVDETRRNLARKSPRALPFFEAFLTRGVVQSVEPPAPLVWQVAASITPKVRTTVYWIVTGLFCLQMAVS